MGPADPFSALVALVGSLSPGDPSRAFVVLWVLALPLAVLGGWFAATRVTESAPLRIVASIAWALAPTFVAALVEGRPAGVLVHLLLPWLFFAASVAHRSWAPAGAASVLLVAVLACAPSLGPATVVLWCAALVVVALVAGRGVGARGVAAGAFDGDLRAAGVDAGARRQPVGPPGRPGVPYAGAEVSADPIGRALLAAGFPTSDPGGWVSLLGHPVWWVGLLVAPLAVLAVLSVLTPRWVTASALVVVAATGIATAFAAVGVAVSFRDAVPVPLWPGAGLSLAWVGLVGAAVVALDAGLPDRVRVLRPIAGLAAVLALAVAVAPAFTAQLSGDSARSALTNGPVSTLPAFVAAEGRGSLAIGTLVLDPRSDGLRVQVVWGGSATLSGQSTIAATRTSADEQDRELASLAVDLVSPSSDDAVARLAERGIGFVLLQSASTPDDVASGDRLGAATSLDQRDMLDPVGETSRGDLWRVNAEVTPAHPWTTTVRACSASSRSVPWASWSSRCCSPCPPPRRAASRGHPRASSAPTGRFPMSERRLARYAATSARLVAGAAVATAAVVGTVAAIAAPWPRSTRRSRCACRRRPPPATPCSRATVRCSRSAAAPIPPAASAPRRPPTS